MLINDLTSSCTFECTEDTPIEDVYRLIQQCDHGFVVVIDSHTHRVPIGVVSEHSICEQVVGRRKNPRGLLAGSVMDTRIRRIAVDKPAREAAACLSGQRPAAIVAIDGKGGLHGVVPFERLAAAIEAQTPKIAIAGHAVMQNIGPQSSVIKENRIF